MRYPVNNWPDWRIAQGFGAKTAYRFHEAVDLNLKTGGDTDLGQPLLSIHGPWECTNSLEYAGTPNWGKKVEYKIVGAWGTAYVQMSHCNRVAVSIGTKGDREGDFIAELGKTGTTSAHCHFAIAKRPGLFNFICKTQADLDNFYDPLAFIEKYMTVGDDDLKKKVATIQTDLESLRSSLASDHTELQLQKDRIDRLISLVDKHQRALKRSADEMNS